MKKLSILTLAAAGMLMASCSQEDLMGPAAGGDGNFNITVKLPADLSTRALGDGYTANKLQYAVYVVNDDNTLTYSFADEADFGYSLQTTLSLNLITNKQYQLAFFAQSTQSVTDGVYTFLPSNLEGATPRITVAYDKMTSASNAADAYDCFFKLTGTYTVGQEANPYEVVLTRPVAQINWGTSELGENNEIDVTFGDEGQYIQTTMEIKGDIYTQFNILESNVDASSAQTVTLGETNPFVAPQGTDFPVDPDTYDYIAVQYVLVPAGGTTYDLSLNINNGANSGPNDQNFGINVPNAPVQANYRTNIYGNLLSTNATFLVEKQDFFAGVNNVPVAWDGTTVTIPSKDSEGNYVIAQPSDLAGLAAMVNGTNGQTASDLSGETFVLEADVDMGGNSLSIGSATRSGNSTASGTASFQGVLDGQGHTISNLTIEGTNNEDDAAAFIPNLNGKNAALKNLNFEELNINAPANEQAGVVGLLTGGATVSGVNVKSGKISAKQGAGAISGRLILNGTIENCSNGADIECSAYNAGGIVGAAYYTNNEGTMTISGCENSGNITAPYAAGGIAGLSCAEVSECSNSGAISGTSSSVGGIIGEQRSAGNVYKCTNTGNVTLTNAPSSAYGTGGIVGWVRYMNGDAYTRQNLITVTYCTNYGNVTDGKTGVGGIVGTWYMCGNCSNNYNYATELSGNGMVAGIVGNSQWTGDQPTGFSPANLLTVNYNSSSTTLEQMTGSMTTLFVYINDNAKTTQEGNQEVPHQNPPTE